MNFGKCSYSRKWYKTHKFVENKRQTNIYRNKISCQRAVANFPPNLDCSNGSFTPFPHLLCCTDFFFSSVNTLQSSYLMVPHFFRENVLDHLLKEVSFIILHYITVPVFSGNLCICTYFKEFMHTYIFIQIYFFVQRLTLF